MTPSDIIVLLAFHVSAKPEGTLADPKAKWVLNSLVNLINAELIAPFPHGTHRITEKGRCLVGGMTALPMPVHEWRMPE